jgi:phosphopentomutase
LLTSFEWTGISLDTGFDASEIAQSSHKVFENERSVTLAKLDTDWNLFIVYTKLLDIVGHLYWQKNEIVEKHYKMIDDFAGEIQNKLPDDAFMIIVSDHGMRTLKGTKHRGGEHSHHAYARFSHEIDVPKPLKITDLYRIIVTMLKIRKDEDIILERLKKLGYV